jgi:hypothetical protein
MGKAQTMRERLESTQAELRELKADNAKAPDFSDPSQVTKWFGEQILSLMHTARRSDSLQRLRALSGSMSSFSSMLRLAHDSSEIEDLKSELGELRAMIEGERKGPQRVAR